MTAFDFHRRHTRRWWYVGGAVVAAALLTFFMVGSAGATGGTVLANSPSSFESGDGDMTLGTSNNTDWNCFINTDNFQTGTKPTGCKTTTGGLQATADPNGEVQWVNGQKFDTKCPALNTGNNPPKDEFTHVAQFLETAQTGNPVVGDLFFYGAAERSTNNGNASGDVEFNQQKGDDITTAGCRTAGDRLVAYDFLSGGTSLNFHVLTWIDSTNPTAGQNNGTCFVKSDSMPCWGANVIVPVAGTAFNGEANLSQINAADNGISGDVQPANEFAEFGVDLTLALTGKTAAQGGVLPCFPQQVWESRSSGSSFTSNPQDIEFQHSNTCGEIKIIKHTDPRGQNQSFSYTTTGGLSPAGFSLNDNGNSSADNAANTQDYTNVLQGTYTVTESGPPSGYSLESLTCTDSGGNSTTTSGATATITVAAGGLTTCVYTNQALGEIKIIKNTNPRGINQAFSYASNIAGAANFSLNDNGNTNSNNAANTKDITNVAIGSYTVTETLPTGWTLGSLSCTATGTGSSGSQDGTTPLQANITLAAGGLVVCTYVNNQPLGAIVITKTGKDKACVTAQTAITNGVCTGAATAQLNGATFSITGTDLLGGSISKTATTATNGTACVDGLPWNGAGGNSFTVTETGAPAGYAKDSGAGFSVTVSKNATCSDTTNAATKSFSDTPLTNLTVTASAQTAGSTQSTITCSATDSTFTNPFATAGPADPATASVSGSTSQLTPGTYYCKVVVDP